jgi:hypothetical protein
MYRNVKAIKRDILNKFGLLIQYGRWALPPLWLQLYQLGTLEYHERPLFEKAVKDLIAKGLLRRIGGRESNLALTQKGFNLIQGR